LSGFQVAYQELRPARGGGVWISNDDRSTGDCFASSPLVSPVSNRDQLPLYLLHRRAMDRTIRLLGCMSKLVQQSMGDRLPLRAVASTDCCFGGIANSSSAPFQGLLEHRIRFRTSRINSAGRWHLQGARPFHTTCAPPRSLEQCPSPRRA